MGLFGKIKNIFYDEEIVDVPEEPKSVEKPKIEEVKVEKKVEPIKRETPVINTTPTYSEREIFTRETTNTFKFPMLDEEEVKPARTRVNALESARMEKKKEETEKARTDKYKDLFKENTTTSSKPDRIFKPSPVISPVYGVLDKNYTKDEVKLQDESSYEIPRASKKIDFETVRNKAYGSLTDDIRNNLCENCELYQEVKITKNADKKKVIDDSNLLVDMTEDTPSNKDVTLGDAEDNYFDFGVSYEQPKREKTEVVINTNKVELDAGDSDIKIVNHNMEEASAEKIEVKEEVPKRKTPSKKLEDTIEFEKKLVHDEEGADEILNNYTSDNAIDSDNDIFNLIDSMYDEEEK